MKSRQIVLLIAGFMFLTTCKPPSSSDINIIPQPATARVMPGSFEIGPDTRIITQIDQAEVVAICEYFNDYLERAAGYRLEIKDDEEVTSFSGDMVITTFNADTAWDDETYKLNVSGSSSVVRQEDWKAGQF